MPKEAGSRNNPKTLTTKMRRFLDQLVERFGDKHTNIKRAELKKAGREILGTAAAPAWITRNLKVRNKEKRGMYDLSVLLKLPVVDEAPAEPKPKKEKKAKPAPEPTPAPEAVEATETPAPPKKKAAAKKKAPAKKKTTEKSAPATEPVSTEGGE